MDSIPGEQWISDYARWIRVHEAKLGDAGRRALNSSVNGNSSLSSTFWTVVSLGAVSSANSTQPAPGARPMLLRQNPHNLYYLLIQFESLGLPVGPLDLKIPAAARPTSYFSWVSVNAHTDKDDTMSINSIRSRISAVSSSFSAASSWFTQNPVKYDPTKDLKYIYSAFTKIPSLRLGPIPARKLIQDFEDCPGQSAVPMDVFKNLQILELDDVDPRTLIGWDKLSMQLRSLTCKKSTVEDITDLLVDLVVTDTKRRRGEKISPNAPLVHRSDAETTSATSDTEVETETETAASAVITPHRRDDGDAETSDPHTSPLPLPPRDLPSLAWHFLRYLNISSNNLTFVPAEPLLCLSGLTNLDLSSNLLNVVPPSLLHLPALTSLNISDNLIDSVLGIYDTLKAIKVLNLSRNRLESLCGLERLFTLERIDLRTNCIYESGEVGRIATLPSIQEVWVKDNPLVEELVDYRLECFVEFVQEGKTVSLDGEPAGFFEKQKIAERVPNAAAILAAASVNRATAEDDEARLANETTNQRATVVKNVRHRGGSLASRNPRTKQGAIDSVFRSGRRIEDSDSEVQEQQQRTSPRPNEPERRSATSSRNRSAGERSSSRGERGTAGNESRVQGGRRRNQRVVELESSPVKSAQPADTSKPPRLEQPGRILTDSENIKQAALSGNNKGALGTPDSKVEQQASQAQPPPQGISSDSSSSTPTPLSSAKLTWSRKSGAAAAKVTTNAKDSESSSANSGANPFAAHSMAMFAIPPSLSGVSGSDSSSNQGKQQDAAARSRTNQTNTLGRRTTRVSTSTAASTSAANIFASLPIKKEEGDGLVTLEAVGSTDVKGEGPEREAEGTPSAIVRQRIARPGTGSAAALARRSRVTASLYDPDLDSNNAPLFLSGVAEEADNNVSAGPSVAAAGASSSSDRKDPASSSALSNNATDLGFGGGGSSRSEAFRKRIEALKTEVGDDWLRLLARGGNASNALRNGGGSGFVSHDNRRTNKPLPDDDNVNDEPVKAVDPKYTGAESVGDTESIAKAVAVKPKRSKKKVAGAGAGSSSGTAGAGGGGVGKEAVKKSGQSSGIRREAQIT